MHAFSPCLKYFQFCLKSAQHTVTCFLFQNQFTFQETDTVYDNLQAQICTEPLDLTCSENLDVSEDIEQKVCFHKVYRRRGSSLDRGQS